MKISKSRLKQIIKEEILKEQAGETEEMPSFKPAGHGGAGKPSGLDPLTVIMNIVREMDDAANRGDTATMQRKAKELIRKGEELKRQSLGDLEPDIASVEDGPEPTGGFAMAPGSEDPEQITSPRHTYGLEESKLKQVVKKELVAILTENK